MANAIPLTYFSNDAYFLVDRVRDHYLPRLKPHLTVVDIQLELADTKAVIRLDDSFRNG